MGGFPVFVGRKKQDALLVLRGALSDMRDHDRMPICVAIRNRERAIGRAAGVGFVLTEWIAKVLGKKAYLDDWLWMGGCAGRKGFEGAADLADACDQRWRYRWDMSERQSGLILKLKNTRIAWLEWMIKQVEES